MPSTLASIVDVAGNVGLPVLFAVLCLESLGLPLPGETALVSAGIVASKGGLSIEWVIVVAAAAAIIGDNLGYVIGRRYGRRILTAPGPLATKRSGLLDAAEPFFARHGPKAVFLGRWVSGLRITAAWMAGISRMHWATFLGYNAAGGIAWATVVGLAAYLLGHEAERIFRTVGIAGVAIAVVVVVVAYVVWRRRSAAAQDGARERPPAS